MNLHPTLRFALAILFIGLGFAQDEEAPAVKGVAHRLPALSAVFPQGIRKPQADTARVEVEVIGNYMDRARHVLFLSPGITGRVKSTGFTRLTLEFEVTPQAAYGEHHFRVISPRGASNILLFRLGDQPHVAEAEPNSTRSQPQPVTMPSTINARLFPDGDFDFYRVDVKAGETWLFDLRSARNGNSLDAALFLLDSKGTRIAISEETFIWDPFIAKRFDQAGTYYAVVQPTHVRNDPTFAYQLDIRQAPHLETIAPLSFLPGTTSEATIYGAGLIDAKVKVVSSTPGVSGQLTKASGNTASLTLTIAPDTPPGLHHLNLVSPSGRSNPLKFLVDATPRHTGSGPIHPPAAIIGIVKYRDPERFPIDVEAGQTLVCEVRAHRFGSPVDSVLRILDSAGKAVATNDDFTAAGFSVNKDSRILHTFKEAGRYQIEVRNLVALTGEHYPYQLIVRPPQPEADLLFATDQPYIYPNEPGKLKITASRRDNLKGSIQLAIEGQTEATIPEGKNDVTATLPPTNLAPGEFRQISVKAAESPKPAFRSVRITSGGGEGATFGIVQAATLAGAEKPLFSLESEATTVNLVRGGSTEIPLSITREPGLAGPIQFSFERLPDGVTAVPVSAPDDAKSVKIQVQAEPNAKPGRYARLAVLGKSADGRVEQAPGIALVVD